VVLIGCSPEQPLAASDTGWLDDSPGSNPLTGSREHASLIS
jgi:hypothetical protein